MWFRRVLLMLGLLWVTTIASLGAFAATMPAASFANPSYCDPLYPFPCPHGPLRM